MSSMDAGLARLYQTIAKIGLPVMVGGGVAAVFYGEPRTTLDIDMVIDAQPNHAEQIEAAIDPSEFYVPPVKSIYAELLRGGKGHFNIIDLLTGLKADLYPAGHDPLIRYGLDRATTRLMGGEPVRVAPATYVVAMKLRYYGMSQQPRHLRDIRSILAMSPEEVDRPQVEIWAKAYSAMEAWQKCIAAVGEE
jgi:hypothetical protein